MGDMKGHAAPGTFFFVIGVWWAFHCLRRYLISRRDGIKYKSSAAFNVPCCCCHNNARCRTWPVEGIIKLCMCVGGLCVEILAHLPVPPLPIVQHATMYCFFLMSGIVDIAFHFNIPLPPGADYMSLALALAVEGLLFANHLHGRPILDVQLHLLLVYVIAVTVFVIILECRFRESAVLTLCRGYLAMLQGTWFWGVGYILYGHGTVNTAWDLNKPEEAMLATIYFSWHGAVNFVILFLMALAMSFYYFGCRPSQTSMSLKHIGNGDLSATRFTRLKMQDDGSDDGEDSV